MKAPKILPAIAHRAGISDELALKLWRRAINDAERLTGTREGSEYHARSVERFLDLVADESPRKADFRPLPFAWYLHHQQRVTRMGFTAMESASRFWGGQWDTLTRRAA